MSAAVTTKVRRFCRAFFFGHLDLRPLEGTALGIRKCDSHLEDLSPRGLWRQVAFYKEQLAEARRFLKMVPGTIIIRQNSNKSLGNSDKKMVPGTILDVWLDIEKVISICRFNLHLLEDYPEHAGNPELALELLETIAMQVMRASKAEDWASMGRRLDGTPDFLWQLESRVRERVEHGPALDRRFTADVSEQTGEIAGYLRSLKGTSPGFKPQSERAALAFERFGAFLQGEVVRQLKEDFALGAKEYGWRMRIGLGVTEPLGSIAAYGRSHLKELQDMMRETARRIKKGVSVPALMESLGKAHPKNDEEAIRLYERLSERAKDFVLKKKLFDVPPSYRVAIVPAPPGMGEAITTAAYFPAPAYDRSAKGFFIVARSGGDPARLAAHNPFHAASTAVHEAFPGHDLQYAYWQQVARNVSPVRHLRGDPRNWGDSMNAEGYAHYTEELMRAHGFFTPEEELFNLSAQAWRAARIVVDTGLHTGGMSLKEATAFMADEAHLPPKVAAGEAFRYSKWPTQAVTYGLGKRGIEQLKARRRASQDGKFTEAGFHSWFLSFGPLPPDAIAQTL